MLNLCYINFEILFDFKSLLFSILKKDHPDLDLSQKDVQENPNKFLNSLQLLKENLSIIKPQIGAIDTINFLKSKNVSILVYSEHHLQLKELFEYVEFCDLENVNFPNENSLIIDCKIDFCEKLLQKKQKVVLFKNHKLKDQEYWQQILSQSQLSFVESWEKFNWENFNLQGKPDFQAEQYKVNEVENIATKYWYNNKPIHHIEFESKIIHGKNRGGSMLGIPTGTYLSYSKANLQISQEISQLTSNLLPGVYAGVAYMNNIKYGAVLSIGYNPYFLDVPLAIEVHLYHEFTDDFYGADLKLIITHFIRPESDFRYFDHLIKAISNDKIVGKKLVV